MSTLTPGDAEALRSRLAAHIMQMDATELAIRAKSEASLIHYLHGVVGAIAGALGYVVGAISGIATGIVESFASGIRAGFDAGFQTGRGHE